MYGRKYFHGSFFVRKLRGFLLGDDMMISNGSHKRRRRRRRYDERSTFKSLSKYAQPVNDDRRRQSLTIISLSDNYNNLAAALPPTAGFRPANGSATTTTRHFERRAQRSSWNCWHEKFEPRSSLSYLFIRLKNSLAAVGVQDSSRCRKNSNASE